MATETQIDLTQFCRDGKDVSPRFTQPFVWNGWRYATDGRIAARVPVGPNDLNEPDPLRRVDTIAEAFDAPNHINAWPDNPPVRSVFDCRTCDGKGRVNQEECPKCNGVGEVQCPHCDQEMDCRECWGHGVVTSGERCPTCKGAKRIEQDHYQRVGSLCVRGDYAAQIRSLPGVRWAGNSADKVHFLFDGGEGVVMKFNVPGESA